MKEKIIKEKLFRIKPVRHILAGDIDYLEQISNGERKNQKFVIDRNIPFSDRDAYVKYEVMEWESGQISGSYYLIKFVQVKKTNREYAEVVLSDMYHRDRVKEEISLVCESPYVEIGVNDRSVVVRLCEDGGYGSYFHYKNNLLFFACISLDSDVCSEESLVKNLQFLFQKLTEVTHIPAL